MRSERTGSAGALRSLLEAAEIRPWSGDVWRCHGRRYAADDATGSLLVTGRFHPGRDRFSEDDIWPALYTGLALHVALGERLRHTTPATLSKLAHQTISQLHLELGAVLVLCAGSDCARVCTPDIQPEDLCRPADYVLTHRIARAARERAEAMLVPSCTRFPEGNLIIFPDCLHSGSSLTLVETLNPALFVDWSRVATTGE